MYELQNRPQQEVTHGSVCSGIEAATITWHPLGMHATWFAGLVNASSANSKPARTTDHVDQSDNCSEQVYPLGQSFHAVAPSIR